MSNPVVVAVFWFGWGIIAYTIGTWTPRAWRAWKEAGPHGAHEAGPVHGVPVITDAPPRWEEEDITDVLARVPAQPWETPRTLSAVEAEEHIAWLHAQAEEFITRRIPALVAAP